MNASRRAFLFAIAAPLLAGCPGEETSAAVAPAFELRAVVQPTLERLDARIAAEEAAEPEPADEEHVHGLITMAGGSDTKLRDVALEEAALLGDACVPALARIAADAEEPDATRQAALHLLAAIDTPRAGESLLGLAETGEAAWVRAHAAWRLGATTQDWIVPRLFLRLKYEKDFDAVIWVVKTLAHFGNFTRLDALATIANTTEDPVLQSSALARWGEILAEAGFEDPDELQLAWYAGANHEAFERDRSARFDREVWRLIVRFFEFQLRGVDDARFVLAGLGERAVELMDEGLHEENVYVRVHTAQCLERMGPRAEPAVPTLFAALADPHLAPNAAAALGAIGSGEAELRGALGRETGLALRVAATRALGKLGRIDPPAETIAALRGLLADDEPLELQQAAAESLAYLKHGDEVAERLIGYLTSERLESTTTEEALRFWLETKTDGDSADAAAAALEGWDELVIPNDWIVPVEERRASLERRQELLTAALPDLVDG